MVHDFCLFILFVFAPPRALVLHDKDFEAFCHMYISTLLLGSITVTILMIVIAPCSSDACVLGGIAHFFVLEMCFICLRFIVVHMLTNVFCQPRRKWSLK